MLILNRAVLLKVVNLLKMGNGFNYKWNSCEAPTPQVYNLFYLPTVVCKETGLCPENFERDERNVF